MGRHVVVGQDGQQLREMNRGFGIFLAVVLALALRVEIPGRGREGPLTRLAKHGDQARRHVLIAHLIQWVTDHTVLEHTLGFGRAAQRHQAQGAVLVGLLGIRALDRGEHRQRFGIRRRGVEIARRHQANRDGFG